ncbi:vacuolar protein sorting-associated protein 33A-like [Oppia nitens]|uniref:vacuolar protein sorting-associated protein 33A-like n=1 Tax=Oppia nitens TaxID=1686743 RepID=UPI0023DCEA9B|nr:vacuolar protein sorting-associated protein 33A-like [Oppia nitens]
MSHLSSGRLNVSHIKLMAKHELLDQLDKLQGTKAIVWDPELIGRFGLVADYQLLKEHQVLQMFELRAGRLTDNCAAKHVVYIVKSRLELMDTIADNIFNEVDNKKRPTSGGGGGGSKDYHIVFVPRRSILCERKLQVLGVYGNFTTIDDYWTDLFALDSDVLSMEWDNSFGDVYVDNDYNCIYHAAKAIMTVQTIYGVIPKVYGIGKSAKLVFDLITRMRKELASNEPSITPQIDAILLIDRSVDLLTPMMQQSTYEGLLDEIYGISHSTIKVPPEKFVQQNNATGGDDQQPSDQSASSSRIDQPTEAKHFHLNSSEELFARLRDLSFKSVGPTLRTSAKALSQQFDERHNARTVREIRQFVDKLPALQLARKSQSNHTSMAELVKEVVDKESFYETLHTEQQFVNCLETDKSNPYIEDCISKMDPLDKVLRLICVQSFCNNGLKPKILDFYKREILQTYGYRHLLTFNTLEKVGLIRLNSGFAAKTYNVLRKTLKLTTQETTTGSTATTGSSSSSSTNGVEQQDISYIYNGYAPLSVRLAQYLEHPGWRAIPDALKLLPEPIIEETQQIAVGLRKRRNSGASIQTVGGGDGGDDKLIAVFFLGGCTYSEISGLRFLSQKHGFNADFIIITTNIINGTTFLKSLCSQTFTAAAGKQTDR